MKSLSRQELWRLLRPGASAERSHVVVADHVDGDLRIRHFRFGKSRIPAVSVAPVDSKPCASALLYCHAHGNAYDIGKSEALEGRPALQDPPLAKVIVRAGWTVFCADMPDYCAP